MCGIFGAVTPGADAAPLVSLGVFSLQHRGQESAGIAVSDGQQLMLYKDLGLIAQLFGGKLPAGTTHLLLEADALLWGFELFGDDAGRRMGGANAFPLP